MNNLKTITLDGVSYIRADSLPATPHTGDIKIVILQRGWIYIGRFERKSMGVCTLTHAANIRNWGTTAGLGELVEGPTPKTVLDKCTGTIEFDWLTVVHTISVNQEKWANKLT